jgi:hypothetical protein
VFSDTNCDKEDNFVCSDDKCIPAIWKCDGVGDCSDRSDEDPHICGNGKVFRNLVVCSGMK